MIAVYFFILALFSSSALRIGSQIDDNGLLRSSVYDLSSLSRDHCRYGKYQSPIHIEPHSVENKFLPALEFTNYHNYLTPPLTLSNNGHTVLLSGNLDDPLEKQPYVTGSVLQSKYMFQSLHFHWGSENNNGSEHIIYSTAYPLEMHIIHRNVLYNSTEEALRHRDGLVVLAILFDVKITGENHRYKQIVNHLKYVTKPLDNFYLRKTFSLSSLLPKDHDVYFVYEGSLTTPPCSEAVKWFVFPQTVPISNKQMQHFRALPSHGHGNFREVQVLGQRKIFLRNFDRSIRAERESVFQEDYSDRSFWLF